MARSPFPTSPGRPASGWRIFATSSPPRARLSASAFSRRIDRQVLTEPSAEFDTKSARERLHAVLAKRLDALEPYRDAIFAISDWAVKEPLSAAALNRETVNSMRFMMEAADIDSEGSVGALKLQGLALAWKRVIDAWRKDSPGENYHALTALDDALESGEKIVDRVEDIARTTEPLRRLATRLWESFGKKETERERARRDGHDFATRSRTRGMSSEAGEKALPTAACPYTGSVTVARRPPSGPRSSVTSPPWLLAISRAMASPSPELPLS